MTPQKRGMRGKLVPVTFLMHKWLQDQLLEKTKRCPDGKKKIGKYLVTLVAVDIGKTFEEVDAKNAEVYPDG